MSDDVDLQCDQWFSEGDDQKKCRSKTLAWLLSRQDQQNIPAWSMFKEVCLMVESPITTAGMLPILQAPAEDNDTLTTVLNIFWGITKKLGQKNCVIFLDQPLYSRCKELIWANPAKYSDVVAMKGGLHILFNFLKAMIYGLNLDFLQPTVHRQ